MNIDEFIKNDWNPEIHQPSGIKRRNDGSSIKSLQSQGSLQLSRTASEKVVDDVWREIQQEDRIKSTSSSSQGVKREPSIGEMTLEDFLAKAEAIDESALDPVMPLPLPLDMDATVRCFSQQMGLSPAPSIRGLSDTFERKRDNPGTMERGFEKRLKRKIKNRESAARSRARKQVFSCSVLKYNRESYSCSVLKYNRATLSILMNLHFVVSLNIYRLTTMNWSPRFHFSRSKT